MSAEIIGLFSHAADSEGIASPTAIFDIDFVKSHVRDYEDSGYDRLLIASSSSWADSISTAAYLGAISTRLKSMIAHRPGCISPTVAARMLATIDQLSNGRAGVHIISGDSDIEAQSDGDFLPKADRYYRSAEYAKILRDVWTADEPIYHDGEYYKFNGQKSKVRPVAKSIPIFWGGASGAALENCASVADVYAFVIEPLARTRELIAEVKGYAQRHNRNIGFCTSCKVIVGDTEEEAWRQAKEVSDRFAEKLVRAPNAGANSAIDALRLQMATRPDVEDERLWMVLNKMTGEIHRVTLVGTGEQVAETLLSYYDLGVRHFLFHGYDTPNDPKRYGKVLIPALRAGIAKREAAGEAGIAY
ncbi:MULTISPECIES: LLM class flavin-dependent oxidoreductase [unclassified Neorhizobium]|uniref:LLM class flavin-dependent oxidoreductase n=1 Tax=unclassified Neorhizobium TaxID=2629175 RepID=UPI001FF6300A|nr:MULTISPECIES: LLM class flavin-dependent oxidoreductase [unclassified Neorhizobium]MCJ9673276.1 LLM class flavin-dependent oxidoreductase [Neorhizobium sp. SHOUNA12B]MCJ9748664.1 LLM class flavin-dependent oxidoreductase [Neorhizobium sp. SHOUNA12A]